VTQYLTPVLQGRTDVRVIRVYCDAKSTIRADRRRKLNGRLDPSRLNLGLMVVRYEAFFEKREFVVESGSCAATRTKGTTRVLEPTAMGLDHGEIVGVAETMALPYSGPPSPSLALESVYSPVRHFNGAGTRGTNPG
jgi:hypothetical protein